MKELLQILEDFRPDLLRISDLLMETAKAASGNDANYAKKL